MLIKYFRSSHFFQQNTIWVLIAVVLWIPAFIANERTAYETDNIFMKSFFEWLADHHRLSAALALLITILSTIVLKACINVGELLSRTSSLPNLMFVIFAGTIPEMQQLHEVHIALLPLLLSVFFIFQSYRTEEPYLQLFNAGLFAAISVIIFHQAFLFAGFVFISLTVFRAVKWRDWVIPMVGIITVTAYMATWFYWKNILFETIGDVQAFFLTSHQVTLPGDGSENILYLAGILPILLASIFYLIPKTNEMIISIRRMYWVLIWMLILATATLKTNAYFHEVLWLLLAPAAIIISYLLSSLKKYRIADIYISIWLISMFIIRFLN